MSDVLEAPPQAEGFYSFEEFRLVHEATERLADRKMEMTRANSSFCSAIIAGQAIALAWALDHRDHLHVEVIASSALLVVAILGIVFSVYWYDQIQWSKQVNRTKFKVLAEIAQAVQFPDYRAEKVLRSINPFEREWEIMEREGQLNPSGNRKRWFTEIIVPIGFMIVFAIEALLLIAWIASAIFAWHLL